MTIFDTLKKYKDDKTLKNQEKKRIKFATIEVYLEGKKTDTKTYKSYEDGKI